MSLCEECGTNENVIRHHASYDPEIIKILCRSCHMKEHQKLGVPKYPFARPPPTPNIKRIIIIFSDEEFERLDVLSKSVGMSRNKLVPQICRNYLGFKSLLKEAVDR